MGTLRTEPSTMVEVVAGVMEGDKQGEVYAFRRAPGQRHAGHWEFPGGKVEASESPEEALIRELDEELGLIVEVSKLLWQGTHEGYSVSFYQVRRGQKEPQLRVHDSCLSVAFSGPSELKWAPLDGAFVNFMTESVYK